MDDKSGNRHSGLPDSDGKVTGLTPSGGRQRARDGMQASGISKAGIIVTSKRKGTCQGNSNLPRHPKSSDVLKSHKLGHSHGARHEGEEKSRYKTVQPSKQPDRPRRELDERRLTEWARLGRSPGELVSSVMSYLPEIQAAFQTTSPVNTKKIELFLKALSIFMCLKESHVYNLTSLLRKLAESRLFDIHLLTYVSHCSRSMLTQNHVTTILLLMIQIKRLLPERNTCLIALFETIVKKFKSVDSVTTLLDEFTSTPLQKSPGFMRKEPTSISNTISEKIISVERPPCDIQDVAIFPTVTDLDTNVKPFLKKNIVQGSFKDKKHYFDVIFRLLREDFIQPLRESISQYRFMKSRKEKDQDTIATFYEGVKIAGVEIDKDIQHVLMLDISELHHINWDIDKRLIYGSLVCLSQDDFTTNIFAVVSQIDRNELRKGILRVKFAHDLNGVYTLPTNRPLVMTENPAYFEAYRHVLEGLQEMAPHEFPFSDHLVNCDPNILPPSYLSPVSKYDLSCIMTDETPKKNKQCTVLSSKSWPMQQQTCLNESQYNALKLALTKRLALLQGPPGTGKTYVGLKIVQVLLNNTKMRCPVGALPHDVRDPILVICFTNHALDQFLEEMLPFCPDGIVRVGSRSTSKLLEEFTINKVKDRHESPFSLKCAIRDCYREMDDLSEIIQQLSYKMQRVHLEIQHETVLQSYMGGRHLQSLLSVNSQKARCTMKAWLNTTEQDVDTHLMLETEERLIQLIGEVTEVIDDANVIVDEDPKLTKKTTQPKGVRMWNISNMPGDVRAKLYKFWLGFLHPSRSNTAPIQIASDSDLQAHIEEKLFHHITSNFPGHNNHSIKAWLLGDTLKNRLKTLEEIQVNFAKLKRNPQKVPFTEDRYKHQTLVGDDSDTEVSQVKKGHVVFSITESSVIKKAYMLGLDVSGEFRNINDDSSGWKSAKKPLSFGGTIKQLKSTSPMTALQAEQVVNVWNLSMGDRFKLYKYWLEKYIDSLNDELTKTVRDYEEVLSRRRELNDAQTVALLKKAKIIGMTTTGAAKHRKVIKMVAPKVVLVEEAAEVIEAHITATLGSNCQHLILIGDHQQLRPKTEVFMLAKEFSLDLSMFERLFNNGIDCVQLTEQRRMRPEISVFVKHIYPQLTDGKQVFGREEVKGMCKNVFFITHNQPEEVMTNSKSRLNPHEAKYLTRLCQYLVLQGYKQEDITIMASYGAQVELIAEYVRNIELISKVTVSTIDNYQGEQNKLILLSLVRSNRVGSVGFLSTDNRVCVALSRAQYGMFVIGNVDLLATKSSLWKTIKTTATSQGHIGNTLELKCSNHAHVTKIKGVKDFSKVPEGGCGQPCDTIRDCGHKCPLKCHGLPHSEIDCLKSCMKRCSEGHKCRAQCYQPCPPCQRSVSRVLPCGHTASMKCHEKPENVQCQIPCDELCPMGHPCPGRCSETCPPCTEKVKKDLRCGHDKLVDCHKLNDDADCDEPCRKRCKHGHVCGGRCSKTCPPCLLPCTKVCRQGHPCKAACSKKCPPCPQLVSKELLCGHEVQVACWKADLSDHPPCKQEIVKLLPCGHTQMVECYKSHSETACQAVCPKTCSWGHQCSGICGQKCPPCQTLKNKKLSCGHLKLMPCHQSRSKAICKEPCVKSCPNGHPCPGKCSEKCPPCSEEVDIKKACGHTLTARCSEKHSLCREIVRTVKLACGHTYAVGCFENAASTSSLKCKQRCEKLCKYGHKCSGLCWEECKPCTTEVSVKLAKCHHVVKVACDIFEDTFTSSLTCKKRCSKKCEHGHRCKSRCGEPCPPCQSPVYITCSQCGQCSDIKCSQESKKNSTCLKCLSRKMKGLKLVDGD